ncbi:hypothetical protein LCGC14_1982650, partial [marine sediment metagenome]
DGYLDLRASCGSKSIDDHDGTTSWNVTNATLWTNVLGDWKQNQTLHVANPIVNDTYLFNFTNYINGSSEGEFLWNVNCYETNSTTGIQINSAFAGNRSININYADPTVETVSPPDNSLSLNGHEITVVCKASPSSLWNLTSVSLKTNLGGGWTANDTHTLANPTAGVEVIANFTINKFGNASIGDGNVTIFGCSATQVKHIGAPNSTSVTNEKSSANRTFTAEYPPQVTLNEPADNNWSKSGRLRINYTVVSAFGQFVAPFKSRIWTNESDGQWRPQTGTRDALNNTHTNQDYTFQVQTAIVWGIQATDKNNPSVFNFSVNRTINIDTTDPTITGITPATDSTSGTIVTITFTPADTNLDAALILSNMNDSTQFTSYRNDTPTRGTEITAVFSVVNDGTFNFSVVVNDSSGRLVESSNRTIIVDLTTGSISNLLNSTVEGHCKELKFTWTSNESMNSSFFIDTDVEVTDGTIIENSSFTTSHAANFDFGFNAEITHFVNITSCDLAGNCETFAQVSQETPARVCAGWSQYAIYDARINLSTIQNQSGADLVYVWDQYAQDWTFMTAGLSSNGGVSVGRTTNVSVVHLFEDVNSSWIRNTTNAGTYRFNISAVNNFVAVPILYTFGNLTETFMNSTRDIPFTLSNSSGNGIPNGTTVGPINLTFFAGYNNSVQDYVSHIFNFTFNNASFLEPCVGGRTFIGTCMETFWVASGFNVSWNGSQIYTNWSAI